MSVVVAARRFFVLLLSLHVLPDLQLFLLETLVHPFLGALHDGGVLLEIDFVHVQLFALVCDECESHA